MRRLGVESLSSEPKARFRQLFQLRASWSREELLPYVRDLVGPGQSADQLLLKHTRVTRGTGPNGLDGSRTYSARI